MKNFRNILSVVAIATATVFTSCDKDSDDPEVIEVESVYSEYAYEQTVNADGSDQRIKIANNEALARMNGATEWTVEAWINTPEVVKNQEVARRWNQWSFTMYSRDRIYFTVKDDDGNSTYINVRPGAIKTNVWQHVAAICDGTTIKLYVDGVNETFYVTEWEYEDDGTTHVVDADGWWVVKAYNDYYDAQAMNTIAADDASANGYVGYGGVGNSFVGKIDGVRAVAEKFRIEDLNYDDVNAELYSVTAETSLMFNFEEEFETVDYTDAEGNPATKIVTKNEADGGEVLVQGGGVRVAL
ncbi:MAG: LamG domain-containing protein [Bacteroidota bacterium]